MIFEAAQALAAWVAAAWAWALAAAAAAWVRWHAPSGVATAAAGQQDWAVQRALVLCDERPPGRIDDLDDDEPTEPDECVDATTAWDPDAWAGDGWEAAARAAAPEFAHLRVELRYVVGGRKHRVVLRPGDCLDWPLYAAARPGCRLPRGVLSAVLVGRHPGDVVDVTSRVKKYAGPHADFYASKGLRVRLRDLFPADAAMGLRFKCMRVMFADLRVREFGFGLDPIVA